MAKICASNLKKDAEFISKLSGPQLERGLQKHADPNWWRMQKRSRGNIPYLKRWGSLLRREARRRGLL